MSADRETVLTATRPPRARAEGEREIFNVALEHTDEAERAAYLDLACASWPGARARIEALLEAAAAAGDFLDEEPPAREAAGARIGRYRLEQEIGEGGFGIVYRARQEEPVRRPVALKIIKQGMNTRAVIARFEAERQALALMEHPNIARVLDGGATEHGRPYFVMELVRGVPITTFCAEQRLPLRARLDLFLQVCGAVHHAHQKGIIHRDLKPSNILVAPEGDRAVAKVIDFGIAKATGEPLTDKTLLTRQHVFVGTPAYMSPEQIGGSSAGLDTRADIYSLGALLYELLSDAPPLDTQAALARGYVEVLSLVQHMEPVAPSQRVAALPAEAKLALAARRRCGPARLIADLRGDLDRIVLKCLEKERSRRYETTDALARELGRFLNHEPVLARPATLRYRAAKFVRRRRRSVFGAGAGLLLLGGFALYHAGRLTTERDRAQAAAETAAKASELLAELVATGDPYRTPGAPLPRPELLEASAARVRTEFAAQPELRAEILNAIGRVYLRTGQHERAQATLTDALAAGRAIGRPDLRLAQTLSDLGVLRRERGDFAGAQPRLEEALALRRRLHGHAHNDVAISLVELGRLHSSLERYDRAEPLFREALAIRQSVLGEHRETATSLGDLALVRWQQGDLAGAEPIFEQNVALQRKTVGSEHPNVGQALANFAMLKFDRHDLAGAERLAREGLAILQRNFGSNQWRLAGVMCGLGAILRAQGRLEEAAAVLDEAREVARSTVGPDHPLGATLGVERARVHLDRDEAAAAEPLLREALRIQQRTYPAESWRIASTESVLGGALLALGRTDEAARRLQAAQAVLREQPGPRGRETGPTRERLAALARMSANAAEP